MNETQAQANTKKTTKTLSTQHKEYLNIILDNGNKEKNYLTPMSVIYAKSSNKNDKSVRSQLTSQTMRQYVLYNVKTVREEASVELILNETQTIETIKTLAKSE